MPPVPSAAFTVAELAAVCGGRVFGDGERVIRGARALERAGPEDASFVVDAKAERRARASNAGVLLVRSAAGHPDRTVVECADPAGAFIDVLRAFFPPRATRPGVHPTAVIAAGARVDESAEIGPFVVVGEGSVVGAGAIVEAHVVIGRRCRVGAGAFLHPHVVLYDEVLLGERVEVHSGAVLGADGFGYVPGPTGIRKVPQVGNVEVGADAEIGANTCIDRAALETTRVGAGTKLDDLVMVGHNCEIGRHAFICGQAGIAGSTTIGDGVVLGGQAGVAGHIAIGRGAKVNAQSGVNTNVPDGESIQGSPHMGFRDYQKSYVEFRRLPETARLVRKLASRLGLAPEAGIEGERE